MDRIRLFSGNVNIFCAYKSLFYEQISKVPAYSVFLAVALNVYVCAFLIKVN